MWCGVFSTIPPREIFRNLWLSDCQVLCLPFEPCLMRIIGPYVSPGKILLANSLRLLPLHCVERAGVRPPPLHRYGESSPTVSGKMETPRSPAVPRHRAPLNRLSEEQPLISLPGGVGFGSRQLELRDTGTPVDNGHPAESEGD